MYRQGDAGSKVYVVLEGECTQVTETPDSIQELTSFKTGTSLGEACLLTDSPLRTEDIWCRSQVHFAVLDNSDYLKVLNKSKEQVVIQKVNFLLSLPMFGKWTSWTLQKIAACFQEQTYKWKQRICRVGDKVSDVYIIRDGEAQLLKFILIPRKAGSLQSAKSVESSYEVALLRTGELIGLEESGVYPYSCICHSALMHVLSISKEVRNIQNFAKFTNTEESTKLLTHISEAKEHLHNGLKDLKRRHICLAMKSPSPKQDKKERRSLLKPDKSKPTQNFDFIPRLYPDKGSVKTDIRDTKRRIPHVLSWDSLLTTKMIDSLGHKSVWRSEVNVRKDLCVNIHRQKEREQDGSSLSKLMDNFLRSSSGSLITDWNSQKDPGFVISGLEATNVRDGRARRREKHQRSRSDLLMIGSTDH